MTMTVNLTKNNAISLAKTLNEVTLVTSWDSVHDVDISALLLKDGKAQTESDFIFYGNYSNANQSVKHSGDVRDGSKNAIGEDDESIFFKLNEIPAYVNQIKIMASIYNAVNMGVDFSDVKDALVQIKDDTNNTTIAKYDLTHDMQGEVCVLIGEFTKDNRGWHFTAKGQGINGLEYALVEAGLAVK